MMIVAQDGSGNYQSIQEAIDNISHLMDKPITIYIKPGIYKEKLYISKSFISLIGEDPKNTIITYGDYAQKDFNEAEKYGTFRSYTAFIGGDHFYAQNITFENSSGLGSEVGQAIAAYVDSDCAHFRNCHFLGYQDTLFTAPLPPAPIIPGSFIGPGEHAARKNNRQYYEHCYIEGEVDFIFGGATAYFEHCEIFSHNINKEVNGYVTAPSTPEGNPYGYVFNHCHFTSNCPPHTVYLARPWRIYAKVAFLNCHLDAHIKPCGFHNWDKPESEGASYFAEYQTTGEGATPESRLKWSHALSAEDASLYTKEAVLQGENHWTPWLTSPIK